MLCEKCKNNSATVYYTYSVNGVTDDIHLCDECAKELVFKSSKTGFENSLFTGLLGEYFGKSAFEPIIGVKSNKSHLSTGNEKICPSCGMSETELYRGGRLGCKECYSVFSGLVMEMLGRLHVLCEYKGKIPKELEGEVSLERKIQKMKNDMQKAVERQDYEEAAKLRDSIKMLENKCGEDEANGGLSK